MLTVEVGNMDRSFVGVFDTDDADAAAKLAVDELMLNHEFFEGNKAHKCDVPSTIADGAWGTLLMDGDDEEYTLDDEENVYVVKISPFKPNTMKEY